MRVNAVLGKTLLSLLIGIPMVSMASASGCGLAQLPLDPDNPLPHPYGCDSIWNTPIVDGAVYADIQEAIDFSPQTGTLADPSDTWRPRNASLDLITICLTGTSGDNNTHVVQSMGWSSDERRNIAYEDGTQNYVSSYPIELESEACLGVNTKDSGNGLINIINPESGIGSQHVGAWRKEGAELLTFHGNHPEAQNYDFINDNGLNGFGRASRLPSMGGAIRKGELINGINHAVAINMPESALSKDRPYIWPASSADAYWDEEEHPGHYQGDDPNYAIGTLLALPKDFDLMQLRQEGHIKTDMGLELALAVQKYGMYIVDTSGFNPDVSIPTIHLAMETEAAIEDLKWETDSSNHPQIEGFVEDIYAILWFVKAVVSNPIYPDLGFVKPETTTIQVSPNSEFEVSAVVKNRGEENAINVEVHFALKKDGVIDPNGMLGSTTVWNIAKGGESHVSIDARFPHDADLLNEQGEPIDYEVVAYIGDPDNVQDAYPGDNLETLANLDVKAADLAFVTDEIINKDEGCGMSDTNPTLVDSNCELGLRAQIINMGDGDMQESVNVGFYASSTSTITTSDFMIGESVLPPIASQETAEIDLLLVLTPTQVNSLNDKTLYIGAIIDTHTPDSEWDKENNTAVGLTRIKIVNPEE